MKTLERSAATLSNPLPVPPVQKPRATAPGHRLCVEFEAWDDPAPRDLGKYVWTAAGYADKAVQARFLAFQAGYALSLSQFAEKLLDAARYRILRAATSRFKVKHEDSAGYCGAWKKIKGKALDRALDNVERVANLGSGLTSKMRKVIDEMMEQPQRQAWRHYHDEQTIDRLVERGIIEQVSGKREKVVRYQLTVLGAEVWARVHKTELDYS